MTSINDLRNIVNDHEITQKLKKVKKLWEKLKTFKTSQKIFEKANFRDNHDKSRIIVKNKKFSKKRELS